MRRSSWNLWAIPSSSAHRDRNLPGWRQPSISRERVQACVTRRLHCLLPFSLPRPALGHLPESSAGSAGTEILAVRRWRHGESVKCVGFRAARRPTLRISRSVFGLFDSPHPPFLQTKGWRSCPFTFMKTSCCHDLASVPQAVSFQQCLHRLRAVWYDDF